MADKRISQLVERVTVANNDVVPIVASGASTTNKATISSIQTFMQGNLDLGVTSVGITLGSTGTDVNVTGSPITTSGNITINIPDASATARGVVSTGTQTFAGIKTFTSTIRADVSVLLAQAGTALPTDLRNISGTGLTSSGSNGFGFNSGNNIYFSGSDKGGGIISFNNTGNQTYTLQNASGTLAFTSDLTGYVTLGTAQTITAQKTFTTSGSSDTMIISHGSGSGIALDVIKAGNGEAIRVQKTSGSGNAVTITGGTLSAEAGQFSGDVQTATRFAASSGANGITISPNVGGTQNRIETTGSLPLSLVSAAAITLAAGGVTPQFTLSSAGLVTLTGALNGTSATFLSGSSSTIGLIVGGAGGSGATRQGQIRFGDAGSVYKIQGGEDYGAFNFMIGSGTPLSIASTGAATFSSTISATGTIRTDGASNGILLRNGFTAEIINPTNNTRDIQFNQDTNATVMFKGNGNVGIGTASPLARLEVTSNSPSSTEVQRWSYNTANPNFSLRLRQDVSSGLVKHVFDVINDATTYSNNLVLTNGNVGIGTASPGAYRLYLQGNNAVEAIGVGFNDTGTSGRNYSIRSDQGSFIFQDVTASAERMRITSGGAVAIGATSTNGRLGVRGTTNDSSAYAFEAANSSGNTLFIVRNDGNVGVNTVPAARFEVKQGGSEIPFIIDSSSDSFGAYTQYQVNNSGGWETGMAKASEGYKYLFCYGSFGESNSKMTLTNTGNLLLSTASNDFGSRQVNFSSSSYTYHSIRTGTGSEGHLVFSNGNGVVGSIFTNGMATFYNATSDYRIKEDLQEIKGLEKVQAIKVYDYKWKSSESRMDGVLAHELAEILPYAVTGEKDEQDENGNDKMQAVDYSKIVPILIKAIQELKIEIDSLKNQIK
jgi:hypothetical protein